MKQILLIEDELELQELLEFNLKGSGYNVLSFSNANDALIAIEDVSFDLILLDLMLPGLQGLSFLDIIRRNGVKTPVIITSAKNTETDIITAINRGADDYVTKPFSIKFLEAKINALFRRAETPAVKELSNEGISISEESYKASVDGQPLQLTHKEFELLLLFMKNPGRVFTRSQLLNNVWGYDQDLMTRTVDAHVASLRKKLDSKGKYIVTVPKIGYLWEES